MKHSCPWAETAEIGVIPERVPVVRTTEVLPRGAQVVPQWQSERTQPPRRSRSPPSSCLASFWVAGQSASRHR